jgi:hypothetical protein
LLVASGLTAGWGSSLNRWSNFCLLGTFLFKTHRLWFNWSMDRLEVGPVSFLCCRARGLPKYDLKKNLLFGQVGLGPVSMLQSPEKADPYSLVLELGPVPLMLQSRKGLPKYDLKRHSICLLQVGPKQHCVAAGNPKSALSREIPPTFQIFFCLIFHRVLFFFSN